MKWLAFIAWTLLAINFGAYLRHCLGEENINENDQR